MRRAEAEAWLRGERSNQNTFLSVDGVPENRVRTLAQVMVADAAMLAQAFTTIQYLDYVADRAAETEGRRIHEALWGAQPEPPPSA